MGKILFVFGLIFTVGAAMAQSQTETFSKDNMRVTFTHQGPLLLSLASESQVKPGFSTGGGPVYTDRFDDWKLTIQYSNGDSALVDSFDDCDEISKEGSTHWQCYFLSTKVGRWATTSFPVTINGVPATSMTVPKFIPSKAYRTVFGRVMIDVLRVTHIEVNTEYYDSPESFFNNVFVNR